ncbi:MAG: hypothetical protein WAM46_10695, partial [Flavobacterium sp.]
MSDFKIIGNANPEIGKEEFYSVDKFLPEGLPFQTAAKTNRVEWEIYILENGKWRKTKENDKSGNIVSYKFLQKSLDRKGIRILARRGEDIGRLDIKTRPAGVPKIDSIELLDKNGQKPAKPLSYGQTLKARVHCLHMEKRKVSVTLWEDDVNGSGHAQGNEKNIMQTLTGVVKNGKADIDFLLRPSFAKIAKKDGKEDKIHEYYVTTDFNREKLASKNVNVNDLETPVAPFKRKVPVQQRSHPAAPVKQPVQPKTNTPAANAPAKKEKGEITNVHLTDTDGRAITGTFKQKQIKVWIDSKGLIGKEIRLKLYDEDDAWNDLLFDQKFTIQSNIYSVVVPLNEIPRSKGGDNILEGDEQEVFAYVEVIETGKHKHSKKVDVDVKVFKPDENEVVNAVMKFFEPKAEDKKKEGPCICKDYDLIWGNKVSCDFRQKVVEICKELWGEKRKKEMANGLMAVMKVETSSSFKAHQIMGKDLQDVNSIEKDDFFLYKKDGTKTSRAVGLIQFTQVALVQIGEFTNGSGFDKLHEVKLKFAKMGEIEQLDYVKTYFELAKDKIKTPEDIYLHVFAPTGVGQKDDFVLYTKGTEKYSQNKSIDEENDNDGKIQRSEILGRYKTSFNEGKTNKANEFTCAIKPISVKPINANAKDIVTYRIYSDGKIEKHIPKKIKEDLKNKYKYVYHSKDNVEHLLGVFNFKLTTEMNKGNKAGKNEVELVDIREFKGYSSSTIKLKFLTINSDSKRFYINPDCYAGLLGAMASMNVDYLGFNGFSNYEAKSTGGSSSHRNGEKGDLRYLSKKQKGEPTILQDSHFDVDVQNNFNDSLYKFGWGRLEKMYSEYFTHNKKSDYLLNHTKHMRKD